MKVKFAILLCACTAAVVSAAAVANPELDAEWEDFKQRYGKQYGDAEEEVGRFVKATFTLGCLT